MKKSATLITTLFLLATANGLAQSDWVKVWEQYPPVGNPQHPNAWMIGTAAYTGIAYDHTEDVVYIVNPGLCQAGPTTTQCPNIHIWDAATGMPATGVGINGRLNVDTNIVRGGYNNGQFSIYRVDVDDSGRIFACNVVAPIWGSNQGPWKLYRWNSPNDPPELVYSAPTAGIMKDAMWGSSFDIIGAPHGGTASDDSVRIFVSGGDIPGFVNDEINVFVTDERPSAPFDYRLGLRMPFFQPGTNFAGSGLAATAPGFTSPVIASEASVQTVLVTQRQSGTATLPQTYTANVVGAVPQQLSGAGGPVSFMPPSSSHFSHLFIADQIPLQGIGVPNDNTHVRSVALSANPPVLWPPSETPPLGTDVFDNLVGADNYITDVDHTIWIDQQTGLRHIQLFVLMSNNGIASYRSVDPMPVPVEFSAFSAVSGGGSVRLQWQVAYESNNHGFEVQRSFDRGERWEGIGFVPGNGTSNKLAEFTYSDPVTFAHREAGTVLYRLKQIDTDGTYMYSPTAEALVALPPDGVTLSANYPNPFNPATTISYGLENETHVSLAVYNTFGERVATLVNTMQPAGAHRVEFNAEGLPSGTYFYRIEAGGTTLQRSMLLTR